MIAIDHGTKKFGFAVSDALRITLEPLEPYRGDEAGLFARLEHLLDERDVEAFVVGVPLNMDGSSGPRADDVRAFMQRLATRFAKVEVIGHDERLTSKAADELAHELGLRGDRARALRDSLSAVVILRDWLRSGEPR